MRRVDLITQTREWFQQAAAASVAYAPSAALITAAARSPLGAKLNLDLRQIRPQAQGWNPADLNTVVGGEVPG